MRRDVQAVVLAKLARLDVSRAASALTDPAVALETVTFAAAPAAALASAVLLYSRRRGAWIRREFSSHINVALVGFRASRGSGKPMLVLFDEVPGCHTVLTYGRGVLSHHATLGCGASGQRSATPSTGGTAKAAWNQKSESRSPFDGTSSGATA